jgi:DNA-nicking Smr family endonuclease
MEPLSSKILQITNAHVKHGGGGAFYVYLRKKK